jgi:hypothetical protein
MGHAESLLTRTGTELSAGQKNNLHLDRNRVVTGGTDKDMYLDRNRVVVEK